MFFIYLCLCIIHSGLDNTVNVVKQQAQYLEKLVTPDEEERSIPEETEEGEKAPENDSVAEIMSKVLISFSFCLQILYIFIGIII